MNLYPTLYKDTSQSLRRTPNVGDGDTGNTPPQDSPPSAASLLLFKSYIDQKFEALEAKLLGAIAASEQAQSVKLDKILRMLEDQASK